MVNNVHYDRPREKLRAKGIAALSNTELLQLVIGSGNATASVSNIARKTNRALDKYGSDITYEQLSAVLGLGIARSGTILASFELAKRFPVKRDQPMLDNPAAFLLLKQEVAHLPDTSLLYVTLDGAKRIIAKRSIQQHTDQAQKLRTIVMHLLADSAESVLILESTRDGSCVPTMSQLQFAKDLREAITLFNVHSAEYYLVSQQTHHAILGKR